MHFFPIPKLKYFRQLYHFTQLNRHQWFKKKYLISIQEKRLRALINHAYDNVPFYHSLFNSVGVKPKDVQTVNDLQKLPVVNKENLRDNYPENTVTKGIDIAKCFTRSTTGSTGIPLKIPFSFKEIDYFRALNIFVWFAQGLRLKDKSVSIRHEGYNFDNILLQKIGILNWKNILIFNSVEEIIKSLKDYKPDVITSFPSMLLLLSQEIEKQNITGVKPRFIRSVGETLTEYSRNKICKIFNCDVLAHYGSEEFGALAFECKKHSGYHAVPDASIIEIIKNDINVAEDEEGEIVVTGLFNYTMPLIRYKLGDIGKFSSEKCTCGRELPLIKSIEGRTDDFLILPSGKLVSPRVINVIENIQGVSSYRTVQESKNKIVVDLVKGEAFSQTTINEIKSHLKGGFFGEDVKVEVNLVKEISRNGRGKLRTVISNVRK